MITYGPALYKALEAATELSSAGIEAEVVDLRVLRPLDDDTILASVKKTHKVLLVEEAWGSVNVSSELCARIMENAFFELDAPVQRLGGVEVPIPYPKHLEDASIPQKADIVNKVKKMLQHD
jgi:pyruvate dehydrogenase E1 component beta subunit